MAFQIAAFFKPVLHQWRNSIKNRRLSPHLCAHNSNYNLSFDIYATTYVIVPNTDPEFWTRFFLCTSPKHGRKQKRERAVQSSLSTSTRFDRQSFRLDGQFEPNVPERPLLDRRGWGQEWVGVGEIASGPLLAELLGESCPNLT